MKKIKLNYIGFGVLLLLAGALLYHMCNTTNQAMASFVIDTEFIGEYSIGGSEWRQLDKDTKLTSFDGDLVLRGKLKEQMPMLVSFYLNHIGVTISVNGEWVFESGRCRDEVPEMMCGSIWSSWDIEELNPEDELEICLHNPHKYGNASAYNDFLKSLHFGGGSALEEHCKTYCQKYRGVAIFIMVISIALLGTAMVYLTQRLPYAGLIGSMGMMSLFMGGYLWMDNMDVSLYSNPIVLNTCVRQCCIMFGALCLADCIRKTVTDGKVGKMVSAILVFLGVVDGILLILSLMDVVNIYNTGLFWAMAQGFGGFVLLFCCIRGCFHSNKENKILLISYSVLLSVLELELANARLNWWDSGMVIKVIFFLLFVFHIIRAVRLVAVNQYASMKAKELAVELRNSRIVLAMSQIRTHFVFNVLTVISGMCEYDPKQADATLVRFSRYLRNNIDMMQKDEAVSFQEVIQHLDDYIVLEQLRFKNKINFIKEFEVTDFKMPQLILQPLVENSIKHGLIPKDAGGTITLHTRTEGGNIIITVADDGVGYDTQSTGREGAVGLENIRFRLTHMVKGKMDIESKVGNGTRVTITIPRKEAAKCE